MPKPWRRSSRSLFSWILTFLLSAAAACLAATPSAFGIQRIWALFFAVLALLPIGLSKGIEKLMKLRSDQKRVAYHYDARSVASISPRDLGLGAGDDNTYVSEYVRRDVDDRIEAAVSSLASTGGFLLLIGSFTCGKTRAAYEALLAEVPAWQMLIPDTKEDLASALEEESIDIARTAIWLDNLQNFMGEDGLTFGRLSRLLRRGPAIVVGTLAINMYEQYRPTPTRIDPQRNEDWKVLQSSTRVAVPESTPLDWERASVSRDSRCRGAARSHGRPRRVPHSARHSWRPAGAEMRA
jgi:hypothetical protein